MKRKALGLEKVSAVKKGCNHAHGNLLESNQVAVCR